MSRGGRIDPDGIIEGCPLCGHPLHVQEHDEKPDLSGLYVKTGTGEKAYRRPLISWCDNEVILTCPSCHYWEAVKSL